MPRVFHALLLLCTCSAAARFVHGPNHNGGVRERRLTNNTSTNASSPHVLFVLWDDYGWTGAGYHKQAEGDDPAEIRTPTLNALVRSGIELDQHYTFYCCSPTRSSIQSGRNPVHVNVLNAEPEVWNNSSPDSAGAGVARNMTGVATKMAAGGYRTHFVGKWDAGMATSEHTPRGRGYHTGLGYFHHENSYWTMKDTGQCNGTNMIDLWVAEEDGFEGPATGYVTSCAANYNRTTGIGCAAGTKATQADHGHEDRIFTGRVLDIIEHHPLPQRLFMFWAPHLVHTSLMVPQAYLDIFDFMQPTDKPGPVWSHDPPNLTAIPHEGHTRQLYAAMVHYADAMLGEVVDALHQKEGMWNETLLVFSTDNGGAIYGNGSAGGNNWPLKGGKGVNWQGGVRGVALASGGWLPPAVRGTKYTGLLGAWDWYATLSELAQIDPTDHRAAAAGLPPIDSVSLVDVLLGTTSADDAVDTEAGDQNAKGVDRQKSRGKKRRQSLMLGTEPTDGFPLGATVGGMISIDPSTGAMWKLLLGPQKQSCWTGPRYPNASTQAHGCNAVEQCTLGNSKLGCLFRLDTDPEERTDLGALNEYSSRAAEMQAAILKARESAYNPRRGHTDQRACEAALARGGFWGPFV